MRPCVYLLFISFSLLISCRKSEETIPAETPESRDSPGAAARYWVAKRLAPGGKRGVKAGLPIERYEAAISHLQEMAVYSTATRTTVGVERRLHAPWIRSFQTQQGFTVEALVMPKAKLAMKASSAAPFAFTLQDIFSGEEAAAGLGTWTPQGPFDAGGRARALIINPSIHDSKIMLLATAGGGIWRTIDGGKNWIAVFDDKPILSVSTLAMAPSNYKIVYAGTGEGFQNIDAITGNGVYLSQDNGIHWNVLAETKDKPDFYYVQKLVVSPSNPDRVYAATGTGVFVRSSTTRKWLPLETGTGPLDASSMNGCTDLAIQNHAQGVSDTPNYVFVGCGNRTPGVVYRTVDKNEPEHLSLVLSTKGRVSLAISPSNPAVVYAMAAEAQIENDLNPKQPGLQAVFRSDSNGDTGTWHPTINAKVRLNSMLLTNVDFAYNSQCRIAASTDKKYPNAYFDQGWYDNTLAVDPLDPKRVWAGGIDPFRSDDSGANWGIAGYWRETKGNVGSTVHADVHDIVFHPDYGPNNQTVFIVTDGGVYKTDNGAANLGYDPCGTASRDPIKWATLNKGLSTIQFYSGAISPDDSQYIGGTQDNGTFFGNYNSANKVWSWSAILGGDGGSTLIDPVRPTNVYATFPPGETVQIYKSTTGEQGQFFAAINHLKGRFGFVTPLAMAPQSSATLWTAGDQIFRTKTAASDWEVASNLLTADNYGDQDSGVATVAAVSPFDANLVLVGTNYEDNGNGQAVGGWIHRTDRGMNSTSQTFWPRSRPRRGWVSSIAFDPSNRQVVYAAYSSFNLPVVDENNPGDGRGHVFKSTNAGESWQPVDGPCDNQKSTKEVPEPCDVDPASIPDIPVHTIAVDPADSKRIWIGTDVGIFTSLDAGQTWKQENAGFRVPVEALLLDSQKKSLIAFTHGRGVWTVKLR